MVVETTIKPRFGRIFLDFFLNRLCKFKLGMLYIEAEMLPSYNGDVHTVL